jgi:sugar (pentulose or hexulose) kinase
MAGVAAGVVGDLEAAARQMVHAERTFEPDPDAADRYDEVYGFYREAQAALAPLFAQRARRSSGLPSHSR